MDRDPAVYIMASVFHGTIYTGVTSDLLGRVYQHREGIVKGFTARHSVKRLVWFEMHGTMETGIRREKQLKKLAPPVEGRVDRAGEPDLA